eukprot:CAMPEP_0170902806 /NCGR_PEP_ID=MMETSP0734-20130129/49308_1 /TAXON_ID=186038 /ORGANISM="Fragilariopsis kerguelensis, Strain L26-C5" /LENGTH=554 /DNA_ID=CAMNT_0011297707 /DNA_START=233 /DNA_END=1895 /DNA_ORIENTATION=-
MAATGLMIKVIHMIGVISTTVNNEPDSTYFGYCQETRQWIFYQNDNDDNTPCNPTNEIAHSSETHTFDISTSYDSSWFSKLGTPMALYFIEDQDEQSCGLYLNDGNCDLLFNEVDYHYDEGDCCAATCTRPSCGFGGITSVFGISNISGYGFPSCIDPSMEPITIRFDNIYGNYNDIIAIDWLEFYEDQNASDFYNPSEIEELTQRHFKKEPKVMSVYVDKSMENETETVMVADGANCTLTIRNSTGDTTHGLVIKFQSTSSIKKNQAVVVSGQTSEQDTINFMIVPNCYIEKLQGYVDLAAMYTDSTPTKEAIDWLMHDTSGNSVCENPYFVERYALSVMSFSVPFTYKESLPTELSPSISPILTQAPSTTGQPTDQPSFTIGKILQTMSNISSSAPVSTPASAPVSAPGSALITMPWISTQRQCLWSQIVCQEGSVLSLTLDHDTIAGGSIATELGLLTNLETLILGNNMLTGTIPSEIGLLTSLKTILLEKNELSGLIPTEIGLLTNLEKIYLYENELSGTIPTEIGLLINLIELSSWENDFSGTIPTEIG